MFTPLNLKPPTSSDVAHAAGVSRATVSLVLNEKPSARIGEATRRRVVEAARQLGYTPNSAAKNLAAPSASGWFLALAAIDPGGIRDRIMAGVAAELTERGEQVMMDGDVASTGAEAATRWAGTRPLAVFAGADRCTEQATELLRLAGVQALLVYGWQPIDYAPALVLPQREYGIAAARHLVRLGHTRLAYVLPSSPDLESAAAERLAGAEAVAREAGCDLTPVHAGPRSSTLRDWAHGWRFSGRPTGVMAFDDRYAQAAVRALSDAGIACPADVSVIGADDYDFAADAVPRLTTVSFSAAEAATRVVDALRAMLEGRTVQRVDTPRLDVLVRESTRGLTA